jgi:hypothetical protein
LEGLDFLEEGCDMVFLVHDARHTRCGALADGVVSPRFTGPATRKNG